MKIFSMLIILIFLTSCTYLPKVVHDPDNARCNLATSKRTIELDSAPGNINVNDCPECLVAIGLYSSATAIISGSIALIGNTVHWLEKQIKCDDIAAN